MVILPIADNFLVGAFTFLSWEASGAGALQSPLVVVPRVLKLSVVFLNEAAG